MRYGFVIDQNTCIGCHACTVACKTEHDVALGVNRTWVKYVENGEFPDTSRTFSVMRCNHCSNAPCVAICPTRALFYRGDGIVDFDAGRCIGCKSCMQACPYDALYIDPADRTAQKCNFCAHRVEAGMEPACVIVCPEGSIIAGDLDDPSSRISRLAGRPDASRRAVEQGTEPNLWYLGANDANLDPLAASPLGEGGGIWRDAEPGSSWLAVDLTPAPSGNGSSRVVYNTDHPPPWGWKVSSYFLTKGAAAGLALALAAAHLFGADLTSRWARWGVPLVAGALLALTGALLVADLTRPGRFHYIITKGNPGSWLVRGAWILGADALLMAVWFTLGVGASRASPALVWIGVPLALAAAGYTAPLFRQAKARNLWRGRTLFAHMLAGALAAGGGMSLIMSALSASPGDSPQVRGFTWTMTAGAAALGVLAAMEALGSHPTANARAAARHLLRGRWARQWWLGGQALGAAVPVALGIAGLATGSAAAAAAGGAAAMAGIWFADDALVRAGQAVPLS